MTDVWSSESSFDLPLIFISIINFAVKTAASVLYFFILLWQTLVHSSQDLSKAWLESGLVKFQSVD